MRWLVAGALALGMLTACPRGPREADGRVARAQLKFSSDEDAGRFDTAVVCFASRRAWRSRPLRRDGETIAAHWCTWKGSCSAPRHQEPQQPGAQWAEVSTHQLRRGESMTLEVTGTRIAVGARQPQGWSARLSAVNGEPGLRDAATVVFSPPDETEAEFTVGSSLAWMVEGNEFQYTADEDPWTWLALVRSSPEALRDEGLAGWTKLHADVVQALDGGALRKCVGGAEGGECTEALSTDEVAAQRARIDAQLASVKAVLSQVDMLHGRLIELAPSACF